MTTSSPEPESQAGPEIRERQPVLKPGTTDPYAVLGLHRSASQAEIKAAYFALVREHPPEQEPETFKLIRAAYERLRTAELRAETDLFLLQVPPRWKPRPIRPDLDLSVHPEDVLAAAWAWSDLERQDFREDRREVNV